MFGLENNLCVVKLYLIINVYKNIKNKKFE